MVALLKLGIDYEAIMKMPVNEGLAYIQAYEELITPPSTSRKFVVKKKGQP